MATVSDHHGCPEVAVDPALYVWLLLMPLKGEGGRRGGSALVRETCGSCFGFSRSTSAFDADRIRSHQLENNESNIKVSNELVFSRTPMHAREIVPQESKTSSRDSRLRIKLKGKKYQAFARDARTHTLA